MFRIFWMEITDLKTAKIAASYCAIVSGWLFISYLIQFLLVLFLNQSSFDEVALTDNFNIKFSLILYLVGSLFFGYITFIIYKQKKYGSSGAL